MNSSFHTIRLICIFMWELIPHLGTNVLTMAENKFYSYLVGPKNMFWSRFVNVM
jgi:hypothetical protein